MKSVMVHQFSRVPQAEIPRSTFQRNSGLKTAFDAGYLVPIFCDEVVPGDGHTVKTHLLARMPAPVVPFMDNLFLDVQYFFVPLRLIQTNFVKMMGEQDNPADSIDFSAPEMTAPGGGYANGSLSDYLTIPTQVAGLVHNSYFHRAYNLIWNTWYRDQNLQDSVVVDKDDGPDNPADYVLLKRGKRHDYFTSCLPWPQKGDSVDIPIGTSAPVTGTLAGQQIAFTTGTSGGGSTHALTVSASGPPYAVQSDQSSSTVYGWKASQNVAGVLSADLTSATAATINQLRQAFQIQKLLERDARGGTRYVELVKSHFGVTSPDARLQRPEYLGGGTAPIAVTPVPQTSETTVDSPQGTLAGYIVGRMDGPGFSKSFTEHGVILGLASIRADLNYQQGLNRMFSRSTRYDFYWPALAMIGEQAVLNKEIYANNDANDDLVFGYQERWAEMRYRQSCITGKMRSNDAASLDVWHLAQEFGSLPVLNSSFIQESPPLDRVLSVTTEPECILDGYFEVTSARPMPMFGVPGLIDHF